MFTVFRNDKVILIKEFDKMKTVGQEYEVANITNTSVVLRDVSTKIAVGAICIDDFDKYFAKSLKPKKWTAWTKLIVNNDGVIFYRTNGVKVQVKTIDNVVGTASCHSGDVFNLYVGIQIAFLRMQNKIIKSNIKDLNANEDSINKIIRDYCKS